MVMGKIYKSSTATTYTKKANFPRYVKKQRTKKQIRDIAMPARQKRFLPNATLDTNSAIAEDVTHLRENITLIGQGTNINERDGASIFVRGISVNLSMNNNGSKTRGVRVLIVSPKSAIGGDLPTGLTDLFSNVTYTASSYDKLSGTMVNPIFKDKYRVFLDKVVKLPPESLSPGNVTKKYWVKINKLVTYAKPDGLAIYNKLYFLLLLGEYDNATSVSTNVCNAFITIHYRDGHLQFHN